MSRRLPLAVMLVFVIAATPAWTLTLDAVSLVVGGRHGDAFRVKGRFQSVPTFAEPDAVVLRLDRAVLRLPIGDFVRKKATLTYRGEGGAGRLSSLRLDTKRGRFAMAGKGWALAGLSNPFPIAVGTDAAVDCGMALVAERGRRKLRLARGARAIPCDLLGIPRAQPFFVAAGTPTEVAVELGVGDGVDPASLRLFRTSAPAKPLCTLAALPGDPAGRFGCRVTVDEPEATLVSLAVEAQANGTRVLSPGFRLPVVAPDAHGMAAIATASAEVTRLWVDAKARLGDSLAARMETLRALQTVPGILSAALSPNGIDIVVRFTNGWQGGLVLNRPPPVGVAAVAAQRFAGVTRPAPRGVFRSCGDDPSAGICCPLDRRTVVTGRDVLIWDTGFFPEAADDAPAIRKRFEAHACLGHQVQTLTGAAADVASMAQFVGHSTLVLSTHGMVDESGRVAICTGEEVGPESDEKHGALVAKGWVFTGFGPELGAKQYLCMSTDYVASLPGRFPEHAVVYASHCYSGYGSAPAVYRGKGAGAYYGFDWAVSTGYTTDQVVPQLFDGLLKDLRTTGAAYDAVEPKVDPTPHPRKVLDPATGRFSEIPGVANFVFSGDRELAYAGKPRFTGAFATLEAGEQTTLEVTVEGAEMCELTHHWVATGERGDLAGGNDVEGTMRSLAFTAFAPPNSGVDDIGVEVLPPDSDEPIGVACGGVVVDATCGDGRRQGTERCDGGDLGICADGCTGSCLCASTTTTTTTSTTSTTFFECTVGVASDCPATQCCDANRRECCDPLNDPAGTCNPGGALVPSGCCSDDGFPHQCAGDPGTSFACPVTCASGQLYVCIVCDGKKIDHVE